MKDTASRTTRILLDVMQAHGIDTIILSPGSRNTPLLISAAARSEMKKYIVSDERTASFMALGIAMASKKPVAIACTSGTALYNYAPAVAEAYYQGIPLIVISADRPTEWIDQDDSQTLVQFRSLDNIVKRSYNLAVDTPHKKCSNLRYEDEQHWYTNRTINEALNLACSGTPGPVHINLQLDNPLGAKIERDNEDENPLYDLERIVSVIKNPPELPPHIRQQLAEKLAGKKILLTAGFMQPDSKLNKAVQTFASLPNVALMCETLSNLHLAEECYIIDGVLCNKNNLHLNELRPDIVISIGGALVSRMLKEYIRSTDSVEHWTLSDTSEKADCFQHLSLHIESAPVPFLEKITRNLRKIQQLMSADEVPQYKEAWQRARMEAEKIHTEYIRNCGWSELSALKRLIDRLPKSWNLFLSNGTPVRYSQLLMKQLPHAVYGNRGVSGIEGTNATAYGISANYSGTTLLITGDTSFSYCPQILANSTDNADLRIVVINNSGGGIFRFIGTTRDLDIREEYFCAAPNLPLRKLCETYQWSYFIASNEEEISEAIKGLYSTRRSLLEIRVNAEQSAEILKEYFKNK